MIIATAQVSVDTTSGGKLIAAEREGRGSVIIINHGTTDVFIGLSGVDTSHGALLAGVKGQTLTMRTEAAIYGIVATSSQTVSVIEEY